MNKETTFYIEILSDFLNEKKTNPIEEINWEQIHNYVKAQNTNGIVFYQCKDFIPKELIRQFNSVYMAEIFNYGKRINLTRELENAFRKENITYCLVKGPRVAINYPVPALRTMGDSDFVVKKEDLEKAYKVMDELGYTLESSLNERCYFKSNLEFELHYSLTYELDENNKEVAFCKRVFEYVKDNSLDDSYHFVFLLLHLKKHLTTEGVGYRQFMDLAVEIKKTELDWDFINKEVEELKLTKFLNTCLTLVYKWFGIKAKQELIELDEDFYNEVTEKILNNGVHGFDSEDNMATPAFKAMSKDEKINIFSKIKYLFNLYFPPCAYFKNDPRYDFLKIKPYLLPYAWLLRVIVSIRNNNAALEIKRSIKGLFMSKKEIEKRQNDNNNWGL